jgi:hypothetical protein
MSVVGHCVMGRNNKYRAVESRREARELKASQRVRGSLCMWGLVGAVGLVAAGCPSATTSPPVTSAQTAAVPAPITPPSAPETRPETAPPPPSSAPPTASAGKDPAAPKPSGSSATAAAPPGVSHDLAGREKCLTCHKVGPNVGKRGGTDVPASHAAYKDTGCLGCHRALVAAKKDGG